MKKIIWILLFLPISLLAQINESDTLRFQTRVNVGGNWQEGNFEIFTLRTKADLSTMLGDKKWVFKTQNNYLYQEVFKTRVDEDFFSRNFLYFKPQSRIYGFAIGFISTNFRRKIDIRYFGGAGATWQIIRSDKNTLKIAAGLMYEESKFASDDFNIDFYDGSRFINVLRSSHWLIGKHEMFGGKMILDYYCFIQPSLQRADNYRWQVEASLDFPLSKALKVGVGYIYTYENVIANGLKNFDQFFTYGFTYQFRK